MVNSNKTITFISKKNEKKIYEDITNIWNMFNGKQIHEVSIDDPEDMVNIEFILGYTHKHFYLFIRTDQLELKNRDRAYQNGDGFHFVLAKPKKELKPTDEFYVIAVSPMEDGPKNCFVWYKNIDFIGKKLENVETRVANKPEGHYFMVKVPFGELQPVKPLLFDEYGFNLAYAQAVSQGTNIYMLEEDKKIQSEQSLRKYQIYEFEEPKESKKLFWNTALSRVHYHHGQEIELWLGALGRKDTIETSIQAEIEGRRVLKRDVKIRPGRNRWSFKIDVQSLEPGKYCIELRDTTSTLSEKLNLTVYDLQNFDRLGSKIDDLKETEDMEVKESILTLKYKYDQILKDIGDLKSYEPFDEIQKDMKKLFSDFDKVKKGRSLYNPGEVLRMACKSGYDGTLQPYSIYIPEGEKNSLMVFLRGSGSDDRSVFGNPYVKKLADEHGIIILAPFARGTSHAFCPDEALEEVREVTNKITQLLPVDENKVILAGFSMGGYGVLRNFDYHGYLYKGLVIISGMYSFGKEFKEFIGDFKIPDYSERIETFQDIPMIFFHGKEDKNCHYDKMESFIEKLATVNDEIEFHAAENLGHSGLTEEWFKKLSDWIEQNF